MSQVIALIPARSGSKGLSDKNIRLLNGKPLLAYTIDAAHASGVFDEIVVSSDSDEILTIAESFGAGTHRRDPSLSQDDSAMDPVIAEFIEQGNMSPDTTVILLQPTSPLREGRHIAEALQWFLESSCSSVISVYTIPSKFLKASIQKDNFLVPICDLDTAYTRRQDLPTVYMPNGAIYIFSVEHFLLENKIPRQRSVPYVMLEECSLDIDNEKDLAQCSRYLMDKQESIGAVPSSHNSPGADHA
ncbi:acylneuraminate cytidylyltransferase family protein [Aurantivibrio infirmus]